MQNHIWDLIGFWNEKLKSHRAKWENTVSSRPHCSIMFEVSIRDLNEHIFINSSKIIKRWNHWDFKEISMRQWVISVIAHFSISSEFNEISNEILTWVLLFKRGWQSAVCTSIKSLDSCEDRKLFIWLEPKKRFEMDKPRSYGRHRIYYLFFFCADGHWEASFWSYCWTVCYGWSKTGPSLERLTGFWCRSGKFWSTMSFALVFRHRWTVKWLSSNLYGCGLVLV